MVVLTEVNDMEISYCIKETYMLCADHANDSPLGHSFTGDTRIFSNTKGLLRNTPKHSMFYQADRRARLPNIVRQLQHPPLREISGRTRGKQINHRRGIEWHLGIISGRPSLLRDSLCR